MVLSGCRAFRFPVSYFKFGNSRNFNLACANFATPATPPSVNPSNTVSDSIQNAESLAKKYEKHVDDAVARWAKCHEVYYGKERDMTNFPPVKYIEQHPKVRLGFLPDSWFQAFYDKTGATGPYVFLFTTGVFLFNKELWVADGHVIELAMFLAILTGAIKQFGPKCREIVDKIVQRQEESTYFKPMRDLTKQLDFTIQTADEEIARSAAVPLHVQAKEENLNMQLEAVYRERLQLIHKTVQRRLNYHVERENSRRRFEQKHMVNWVVDNVIKGITPAQEKETLVHCINELKRLAKVSQASLA